MKQPGEEKAGKLNEVITIRSKRADGSIRIQQDFEFCPTMTEQHTAHLTDIDYLITKYKPDELAAYIAARSTYRQEILGHDFSKEPNLQEAKNITLKMKKDFEALDPKVTSQFQNHIEFLKFIDNPANAEKMLKLGLMTKREVATITGEQQTGTGVNDKKAPTNQQTSDNKVKP